MLHALRETVLELQLFGITPTYSAASTIGRPFPLPKAPPVSNHKRASASTASASVSATTPSLIGCTGCGRTNHQITDCMFGKSQYFNFTSSKYWDSAISAKLHLDYPTASYIPGQKELLRFAGATSTSSASSSRTSSSAPSKKQKGEFHSSVLLSSIYSTPDTDYLSVSISPLSVQLPNKSEILVKALLDTGSIAGDFIAARVISIYNLESHITSTSSRTVCSGLDSKCYDISKSIALNVSFYSELLNKTETFEINATILSSTPIDLVIGRPSIKKYNLFSFLPSQISLPSIISAPILLTKINHSGVGKVCGCQPERTLQLLESIPTGYPYLAQNESPTVAQTPALLAAFIFETEKFQGGSGPDEDEIDYDKFDMISSWNTTPSLSTPEVLSQRNIWNTTPLLSTPDVLSQIHIGGSESLQKRLRALCLEFKDIFCNELPSTPAKLEPFDLDVDVKAWQTPANRTPPRPQSAPKQKEILRHIDTMLRHGIIEKSTSAYYSQVLLVAKADSTTRLVIDFRKLNTHTIDASWPIPHIPSMLRRIGAQKPTIFGCVDLTQGYHQAPLSERAKPLTSFITFSGVYQYTRLPFGLKRAPSYFQEQMASVVLNGLIYSSCEMYIADCNIFASSEDQFIDRLREIFLRFRQHYLFLKATKCYFGFPELDFVGKVVSESGLKMSQDKIRSVLDFPIPLVSKQLKSFLGLVNYFHDFIRNHSSTVKPLHALIENYERTKKIQ
jgi:hypothetical protein